MDFTLPFIGNCLKTHYPELKIVRSSADVLQGCRLASSETVLCSDFLYIVSSRLLFRYNDIPAGMNFIIVESEPPLGSDIRLELHIKDSFYILMPPSTNKEALFDRVSELIDRYRNWETSLLKSAIQERNIQTLIDMSGDIFKNYIVTYDASLRLLGADCNMTTLDEFTTTLEDYQYMSDEIIRVSEENRFFELAEKAKKALFFNADKDLRLILAPIRMHDKYLGILTIPDVNKHMSDYHLILADTLAYCMAQILKKDISSSTYNDSINQFFIDILSGKQISQQYTDHMLKKLMWGRHDRYIVLAIKPQPECQPASFDNILHIRYLLMQIFKRTRILIFDDAIVIIFNKIILADTGSKHKETLRMLLIKHRLVCGLSNEFDYFPDLENRYLQAKIAADHCTIMDSLYPLAMYENHLADHAAQLLISQFDYHDFIHPSVLALFRNDKKHKGHLTLTLFTYLMNDRSYSECAKKLYIHKSTLNYRLEKIRSLVGTDVFQPTVRLNVLFSIKMILLANGFNSVNTTFKTESVPHDRSEDNKSKRKLPE